MGYRTEKNTPLYPTGFVGSEVMNWALADELQSSLDVILGEQVLNSANTGYLRPDGPPCVRLTEAVLRLPHMLPRASEAPCLGGGIEVLVGLEELERHHGSLHPSLCDLKIINPCQADELFSVDHLVLMEVLEKRSPNGASE